MQDFICGKKYKGNYAFVSRKAVTFGFLLNAEPLSVFDADFKHGRTVLFCIAGGAPDDV